MGPFWIRDFRKKKRGVDAKVILRMFMLQHIIACGWFGIGEPRQSEKDG